MPFQDISTTIYNFIQLSHNDRDFIPLVDSVIDRQLGRIHGTQSHVNHSIGVVQKFLEQFPSHITTIKLSTKFEPFDIRSNSIVLNDFITFLSSNTGTFGRSNEFSFDTLRRVLPVNLGGEVSNGGGGGDEFKRVLRLVAEII